MLFYRSYSLKDSLKTFLPKCANVCEMYVDLVVYSLKRTHFEFCAPRYDPIMESLVQKSDIFPTDMMSNTVKTVKNTLASHGHSYTMHVICIFYFVLFYFIVFVLLFNFILLL